MVDEQSVPISLASPLDINSGNMLVPVNQPKFAYNRQKYQGSLLQTSVRYEADGWFAGWWGHNFDLVVDAEDYITPPLGDPSQLSVIRSTDENGNKVYEIRHKDLGLKYTYNPTLWSNWITGTGTITRISDTTVSIPDGETNKGDQFTATVDPYTGMLTSFVDVGSVGLKSTAHKDGENIRLEVIRDMTTSFSDYIDLRVNNVPEVAEIPLKIYSYDRTTNLSTWNQAFTLKVTNATVFDLVAIDKSFVIQGTPILSGYNTKDEQVTATVRDVTINHLIFSFEYAAYWVQDLFATASVMNANMSQQVTTTENEMTAKLLDQGSTELMFNNSCVYRLGVPIWLQHYLEFDYSLVFAVIDPPVIVQDFRWRIAVQKDDEEAEYPALDIPGFVDFLNTPGVLSLVAFTIPGTEPSPSPYRAATRTSKGKYTVVQPNNPRYSIFQIELNSVLVSGNLLIPPSFQPYRQDTNPGYDPRPVIWAGDPVQIYGLTPTGSICKTMEKNLAKYDDAKVAMTIAEMDIIPDGVAIPLVPEYEHTSGELGVDLLENPWGYQPDPTLPNYDPREYVHAIWYQPPTPPPPPPPTPPPPPPDPVFIVDPDVKSWTDGQAAVTNTAWDNNWSVSVTPNYTRYWLKDPQPWQADWNTEIDVGEFWPMYWPTLPVPKLPLPKPQRSSPYDETAVSGVVNVVISITTDPDTTLATEQPASEDGELLPPMELPYRARLRLGNFQKKSILHSIKNITDKTNWSWAFRLQRTTITTTWYYGQYKTTTSYAYYNSNGRSVSSGAPLVWKPITEDFPGLTVYDRPPSSGGRWGWWYGYYTTNSKDTWVLYFKCKNGELQFPIPINDFNNVDKDGSNYFQVELHSNGNFRTDQVLMSLVDEVTWVIPSYTSTLYADNYKVLNEISLTRAVIKDPDKNKVTKDPGIFQGTNVKGILNVPLCVPGYAVSRITTPRILNSDLSAFEIENGIDNDYDGATYMWRIDFRNASYPYDLNLVTAMLSSVQFNSNSLFISYTTTGIGPFYQLTKQPYAKDVGAGTGDITSYQDYAYPDWILRNLVQTGALMGNYSENEYSKIFIPGTQMATISVNITTIIKALDFITYISVEPKYDATPYNRQLFVDIEPYYTVTKPAIQIIGGVEIHNQSVLLSPNVPLPGSTLPVDRFEVVYNPDTTDLVGMPIVNFSRWNYVGYSTKGTTGTAKKVVSSITIDIQSPVTYDLVFRRTLITAKAGLMQPVTGILTQENNIATLNPIAYGQVDFITNTLDNSTLVFFTQNSITDDVVRLYVAVNNSALVYFKSVGLIARNDNSIIYDVTSTLYELIFEYKTVKYTLHLDTRINLNQYLSYTCTDIRTGEMFEVYHRDLDNIKLFVKQFWSSTVDVENYWWIDADHVLELSKHALTLYKKVGYVGSNQSVHDWNGDNWEVAKVSKRSDIILIDDLYYSATSAYDTSSIFFKLSKNKNQLRVQYIDPLTMDWEKPDWAIIDIPVVKVPLLAGDKAQALPHDSIASYGPLNVDSLISVTKISSTVIKLQRNTRMLLIGIKQNNGLGQWTLKIDVAAKTVIVIIGYGCVGPKGELTGGQIPIDYCDANGFNGIVQELSALPPYIAGFNALPKLIVGTSSQQWFIQSILTGIVSHLTFDVSTGTHVPVSLYLNNNTSVLSQIAQYRGARVQDVIPQSLNISTLFGAENPALTTLMGVVSPSMFFMNILYSTFAGLAIALGAYAYVWRNSIDIKVKGTEDLTDQDRSFGRYNRDVLVQVTSRGMHTWAQIITHLITALPETIAQATMNKTQGQTSPSDSVGRKFAQFSTNVVSNVISTSIDSNGFDTRAQSTLINQYSLTNFYSINDKIECHAGPGFVNHNLKAQCIAQSMQDLQMDGKQVGFFSMLSALTKLTLSAQNAGLVAAQKLLERIERSSADQSTDVTVLGSGSTINWGYAIALATSAGMTVTDGIIYLNEKIMENLDKLAEMFGGAPSGYLSNWISVHSPTLEGTHTYGNKSMSFFWPAFGVDTVNTYTNEGVQAICETTKITLSMAGKTNTYLPTIDEDSSDVGLWLQPFEAGFLNTTAKPQSANIPVIKCLGKVIPPEGSSTKDLLTPAPENMAVIEGTTTFLSQTPFKNEQIGVGPPAFGPPMIHDFMIDKTWALGYTAGAGAIISVSCDDTKLIDGPPSNVIITNDFCGIASSYIALEIKKTFDEAYLRPTLVTANAIGLNINGINCVHDAKAYHAFDGQVNRIVSWTGGQGMDKELLYQQYLFQMNDHFKRSNIFPPAQFFGSFQGPPVVEVRTYNEPVSNTIVEQTSGLGFGTNTPGENRNLQRFSTCVFSELLSSLPTTVRTLAPYKLRVNDGVTCLVTELRNTNTRYKAPTSIDFSIGTRLYRQTEEYIVEITEQSGAVITETRTPSAGLEFVGPTMTAAYFYSPASKLYYEYAGGTEAQKKEILNRFRSIQKGRWDFINQEVIFSAQLSYTGEEMVLRLDDSINGEVWPPNKTIYNERSGYKIYSCAGGLVYQGPKRFIVSRFVTLEHMIPDIKRNKRKWKRVEREEFVYERDYGWEYKDWYTETPNTAVYGWTHNPYLLVTSMLGTAEDIDNKFEWSLTFAWTETIEHMFEDNEYVTVNVMAETVTQGGVVRQRPTHIFLNKEVFTRSDNAGYYTIKFQSNNGTGNRERLFIWSDGIIAQEDLKIACKQVSASRTQPLITQVDLERLTEL